ncbi:MAG TPA: 7-carboxy-7-deazaguanine synthase QueE [Bacteroidales bacterium]|nr:7-carboxy-7-deazaguanine synthase QueE [Bacteroidales bacterium]HPT10474.1 7-carboxy-7-deazaguanine synthase QueE [Bacteroidales bacterium]
MDTSDITLLNEGKMLPVMEAFYTLQGEGFNTGQAACFVRIGGCDVGCWWCDVKESWNASLFPPTPVDQIVAYAASFPAKAVVVTGGEPLLYNLDYFCKKLKESGIRTYLETSGSLRLSGSWDWICLSPKKDVPPLPETLKKANELKVIIHEPEDLRWAETNRPLVSPECLLYLQPEWSSRRQIIPVIIDYIKKYPVWKISLQSHKYMNIP